MVARGRSLRGLIIEAGRDAVGFAATILGFDQPRDITAEEFLDISETPAAPVKVAGAVALGMAEAHMYWSAASQQSRDYVDALTGCGWTPEDWTASALSSAARPEIDTDQDTDTGTGNNDDTG